MADIKEIFAENLKKTRRKRGLTQEKLAEKAGMSLQYLALLEIARKFPSGEMLERLAKALEIETYELLAVASSANNELELLRKNIICEVKTLHESLVQDITNEVIKTIKQILSDELKTKK
ncbi:MAG: helix-turn-helix domain-containing protein [Treponema sp.]|jgi:transcriptional regulator with XRE-family HTH domain|nr:helix-turn-helix domain-containing protein [Treponema sp.]